MILLLSSCIVFAVTYKIYLYCSLPDPIVALPGGGMPNLPSLMDQAALEFCWQYNQQSITQGIEIGACIVYRIWPAPHFLFDDIKLGNANSVDGTDVQAYENLHWGGTVAAPAMRRVIAGVHTHSNLSHGFSFDDFSQADKQQSRGKHVPEYLATPLGSFKRYDPPPNLRATAAAHINNYQPGGTHILLPAGSLPRDTRYDGRVWGNLRRVVDLVDNITNPLFL